MKTFFLVIKLLVKAVTSKQECRFVEQDKVKHS